MTELCCCCGGPLTRWAFEAVGGEVAGDATPDVCATCVELCRSEYRCLDCIAAVTIFNVPGEQGLLVSVEHDDTCPSWKSGQRPSAPPPPGSGFVELFNILESGADGPAA